MVNQRPQRAAVTLLLLSTFLVGCGYLPGRPLEAPKPPTWPMGADLASWRWTALGASPIPPRTNHVALAAGKRLFVWGGLGSTGGPLSDGATFDAASGWHKLPRSPLSPRSGSAAVWDGHEVIIWGGTGPAGLVGDGAAYDPARSTWRMLAPAPLSPRVDASAFWTGDRVIVVGGTDRAGYPNLPTDAAEYFPVTDTWRKLSAAPRGSLASMAGLTAGWTGSELVEFQSWVTLTQTTYTQTVRFEDKVVRFDLSTGRWSVAPGATRSTRVYRAQALPFDHRLIVYGGTSGPCFGPCGPMITKNPGALYDPSSGTWWQMPDSLVDPTHGPIGFTGRVMVVVNPGSVIGYQTFPGNAAAYDAVTNAWTRLEDLPQKQSYGGAQLTWIGDRFIVWGGTQPGYQLTSSSR